MNQFESMDLVDIHQIIIRPKGYVKDLVISVGIGNLGNTKHLIKYFSVKGTEKVFKLDIKHYNKYFTHYGSDEKIFENFFNTFRVDYLSWQKEGFKTDWQKQYKNDFEQYIYTI